LSATDRFDGWPARRHARAAKTILRADGFMVASIAPEG